MLRAALTLLWGCCFLCLASCYEVPKARIQVFYPKGFEVSIPHGEGITLFAFHGKLNEEMEGLEAGTWARDIVKMKNGRWTFRDRVSVLKPGDVLYYWTYVIYNGLGYREDDGVFTVSDYSSGEANTGSSPRVPVVTPLETTTPWAWPTDPKYQLDVRIGCNETLTWKNGAPVKCGGQMIFVEEFNSDKFDPASWLLERRFSGAPDYEFNVYVNDAPSTMKLNHGHAVLEATTLKRLYKQNLNSHLDLGLSCTGEADPKNVNCVRDGRTRHDLLPPMVTAQFSTKRSFSFKYGRVEVRAKMPGAAWLTPQLWLEPKEHAYGSDNYESGQIRLAFTRPANGKVDLYTGALLAAKEPMRSAKICQRVGTGETNDDWVESFHNYTLLWTPREMKWLVDGRELCRHGIDGGAFHGTTVNGQTLQNREILEQGSDLAPFDKEFYLTFGMSVGGFNEFFYNTDKPWAEFNPKAMKTFWDDVKNKADIWLENCQLKIDYVKVFSL
ncbi:uncharacterized protein Dwil_GK16747 [Drosophila willistoni]|uniref:Uncharacterized protein n=1 Tax=Drosophila willistoni TaxID=7260 RepID=B4MMC4_DROWI|nr:gram-negative bacteria-binding protein 3 [Drosophila willistoni]EDW73269.1 uncharacterized protein Dwil_GK16747 [Drosophila willistoni]